MINPTHLRIGNWVFSGILPVKINHTFEITDDYNGIPLTEEILRKAGIDRWFHGNSFELRINLDGSYSIFAWAKGKSIFLKHTEFVHDFQNFYFSLTGEELQIEL